MELKAPRNLNEPARCKFSHLKHNFAPARESAMRDRNTGVRCANLSSRFVAASISAYVGSRTEGGSMSAVDESVLGMCFLQIRSWVAARHNARGGQAQRYAVGAAAANENLWVADNPRVNDR